MQDKVNNNVLVTNIQRMCFHDGPGIRTTVFLKGCNLCCPWCANPENISHNQQSYEFNGVAGLYGQYYDEKYLLEELKKDKSFYGDEGGVTFSGGEPLLRLPQIINLLKELKKEKISVAIESAMHVPFDTWGCIAEYIDYYLVDIKLLEPSLCQNIIGGNVDCYLSNIRRIYALKKNITFRIPLNKEFTMQEDNLKAIYVFLRKYNDIPVEIFATHSLGNEKYKSLGKEITAWEDVSDNELKIIADNIRSCGSDVTINRL